MFFKKLKTRSPNYTVCSFSVGEKHGREGKVTEYVPVLLEKINLKGRCDMNRNSINKENLVNSDLNTGLPKDEASTGEARRLLGAGRISPAWTAVKYSSLFLMGAVGYGVMELIWRGYTHYSMLIAGGCVLCGGYYINSKHSGTPLLLRSVATALLIVTVELVFGLVFNIMLGEAVWDYSDRAFNFCGQICPLYSLLWLAISAVLCAALDVYYAWAGTKGA